LKQEGQDPVGKLDLVMGLLLFIAYVVGCVPSAVVVVVRLILNQEQTNWALAIPLVGFVALGLFAYLSLKLIPQKPPV
jgi:hypothetical protein